MDKRDWINPRTLLPRTCECECVIHCLSTSLHNAPSSATLGCHILAGSRNCTCRRRVMALNLLVHNTKARSQFDADRLDSATLCWTTMFFLRSFHLMPLCSLCHYPALCPSALPHYQELSGTEIALLLQEPQSSELDVRSG